jgi:8-oxo-dGTP pyrophosphatase MutT (NUDIX family)
MDVAASLRQHIPADAQEREHLARILEFVARHPRPFDRTLRVGHLTGSAIVVSASADRVLLLHHRKLGLWLQPGGHGEAGEATGEAVALREAGEETGMRGLALHPGAPRPLDVDIHAIPAHENEPAHEHLDLRYLVIAPDSSLAVHDPAESHAIRWFTWPEVERMALDPGLRRALEKVKAL